MKFCKKCGTETEHNKLGRCIPCAREAQRKWRAANPERNRETYRKWRAANQEKELERNRKYKEANREKTREQRRKWYAANPERSRNTGRKWRGLPTPTRPEPETCESCGGFSTQAMHLDHDHATDKFRGWLCGNCNRALGLVYDDPTRLRALIAYLERSK